MRCDVWYYLNLPVFLNKQLAMYITTRTVYIEFIEMILTCAQENIGIWVRRRNEHAH